MADDEKFQFCDGRTVPENEKFQFPDGSTVLADEKIDLWDGSTVADVENFVSGTAGPGRREYGHGEPSASTDTTVT